MADIAGTFNPVDLEASVVGGIFNARGKHEVGHEADDEGLFWCIYHGLIVANEKPNKKSLVSEALCEIASC